MTRRVSLLTAAVLVMACQSHSAELGGAELGTLDLDLRIGSLDDRHYALTPVGKVEVDADGTMYVQQPRQHTIKVYDSAGKYVRNIGRMGAGPGEFQSMFFMGWVGDTLWVFDGALSRLNLFARSGDFLRSVRFPGPAGAAMLVDGSILLSPFVKQRPSTVPLLRVQSATGHVDTLATLRSSPPSMRVEDGPVRYSTAWHPFNDETLWEVSPDGSFILIVDRVAGVRSDSARFSVSKLDYSGDTLWHRSYPYRPRPLTDAVIATVVGPAVDRQNASRSARGGPLASFEAVRKALYRPETLPPVTSLVVGSDESVWLRREDTGDSLALWDVLDKDGKWFAAFELPNMTQLRRASRDFVWALEHDTLDIPYVVRYRVRFAGGAS